VTPPTFDRSVKPRAGTTLFVCWNGQVGDRVRGWMRLIRPRFAVADTRTAAPAQRERPLDLASRKEPLCFAGAYAALARISLRGELMVLGSIDWRATPAGGPCSTLNPSDSANAQTDAIAAHAMGRNLMRSGREALGYFFSALTSGQTRASTTGKGRRSARFQNYRRRLVIRAPERLRGVTHHEVRGTQTSLRLLNDSRGSFQTANQ
jgi:hypothetical protein